MLVHTVFIWLKDGSPADAGKRLIDDCAAYLGKIPSVRHLWAAFPSHTPKREVVDHGFDVGLTVVMDDVPGHDVYQEHPLHIEFLARNKEHWAKVKIYDAG